MHALPGRLILMTRWCTEAQGSTVLGPHWDKCTWGGTQPLSPHMITLQLDTLSVYLVRCLVLQWIQILSQRSDDWQRNCGGIYISRRAVFYVGGPGRTYGKLRLGWTDLGLAGVKLWGLRPERKAVSKCVFKCQPLYYSNEFSVLTVWTAAGFFSLSAWIAVKNILK